MALVGSSCAMSGGILYAEAALRSRADTVVILTLLTSVFVEKEKEKEVGPFHRPNSTQNFHPPQNKIFVLW